MVILGGFNKERLDGEKCFHFWMELGTLSRTREKITSLGIINPRTGEPYSQVAVHIAANRWMLENLEEAWTKLSTHFPDLDRKEFEESMVLRATYTLNSSRRRLKMWVTKFGMEKYNNIIRSRMTEAAWKIYEETNIFLEE